VDLPERRGREAILRIHTRNIPLAPDVNLEELARGTPGFSGADLANLVNEAALVAARKGKTQVDRLDFQEALDKLLLGGKREALMDEQERRIVAYHEGGHALVAALLPDVDPLYKVTIVPRGRALGVTHVLEGSVRKSGERLRITAQLVRADNGYHVWSETYDRDARDIFAVQDDITRAVTGQLRTTLLGTEASAPQQSTSAAAYTLYLQARHLVTSDTRESLVQAATLYHQALDLDPNYAPAWVGLARCLGRQVAQGIGADAAGPTQGWYAAQNAALVAAANRAIALNPDMPDAYVALATAHMQFDRSHVHRSIFHTGIFRLVILNLLRQRHEEHRTRRT